MISFIMPSCGWFHISIAHKAAFGKENGQGTRKKKRSRRRGAGGHCRRGLDKRAGMDYNRGAMTGRSNLPGRSREQAVGASLSVLRTVKVAPEPRKKDVKRWTTPPRVARFFGRLSVQ